MICPVLALSRWCRHWSVHKPWRTQAKSETQWHD